MQDDWVTAALFNDSVVAELLSRLKQSSSPSSSFFSCQPPKLLSLPLGWGHRQPRSKPPSTATKKDSTTNTAPTTTRCSPTTPLSWSGCAASPSDGAYDDCSNSPTRPLLSTSSSSSDPSRSKVCILFLPFSLTFCRDSRLSFYDGSGFQSAGPLTDPPPIPPRQNIRNWVLF